MSVTTKNDSEPVPEDVDATPPRDNIFQESQARLSSVSKVDTDPKKSLGHLVDTFAVCTGNGDGRTDLLIEMRKKTVCAIIS